MALVLISSRARPRPGQERKEEPVNIKSIADKVRGAIQKRGGTESVKEDAGELKDIASGEGSAADKAKKGADAIKEPGAPRKESGAPRKE
jgi:hypothetical protein